jgi:hypothetical protein
VPYRIVHLGVPIGEVDLDLGKDPAAGTVTPLPGYAALRNQVRAATRSLRAFGIGLPTGTPPNPNDLAAGAALGRELELRDEQNALVKTDFIELCDWEGEPLGVTVWVRARGALAGTPGTRRRSPRGSRDAT